MEALAYFPLTKATLASSHNLFTACRVLFPSPWRFSIIERVADDALVHRYLYSVLPVYDIMNITIRIVYVKNPATNRGDSRLMLVNVITELQTSKAKHALTTIDKQS